MLLTIRKRGLSHAKQNWLQLRERINELHHVWRKRRVICIWTTRCPSKMTLECLIQSIILVLRCLACEDPPIIVVGDRDARGLKPQKDAHHLPVGHLVVWIDEDVHRDIALGRNVICLLEVHLKGDLVVRGCIICELHQEV